MPTQEELKLLFEYNPETGFWKRLQGTAHNCIYEWFPGSLKDNGYYTLSINNKNIHSHRLAWLYMTGSLPQYEIDHVNQNRGDNRWCNLREVLPVLNKHNNLKPGLKNTSGFVGVSVDNKTKKWRAQLQVNKVNIPLGLFLTPEDAYNAYLKAKEEHLARLV